MSTVPFFSVIMPVYGVERYLHAAVHSVLSQSCGDFELILVDDCSPDGCPQLCNALAREDARIVVIHKPENQGLGMARNSGMQQAKGEYVLFVDSDDLIHPDTLSAVKSAVGAADIVAFGMKRVYESQDGSVMRTELFTCPASESGTRAGNGDMFLRLTNAHLFPYVCNKVYRRSFLEQQGVTFETTKLIEDFLFNIALFEKAERIVILEECLYHYRKPAHGTLVNRYAPEFYELTKRKYRLEREFLQNVECETAEAVQTVLYSHIKHLFSVFLRNHTPAANLSAKEQIAAIRTILADDTTHDVLREFRPHGAVQTAVALLLRSGSAWLCYGAIVLTNLIQKRWI